MPNVQRILATTDFGDPSVLAIRSAMELADRFHAELDILHMVEEPFGYVSIAHGYLPEVDLFRSELCNAARRELDSVLNDEDIKRLGARKYVVLGSAAAGILMHAEDHNTDLIVIGTHGRGPMMHALMGSVAERVVRHAPCPVLTVRMPRT